MIPFYAMQDLNDTALRLMQIGAIKIDTEKGFKLKHHEQRPEAPLSPVYINLRVPDNKGVLEPGDVGTIARLMYAFLSKHRISFQGICGIPRAGEPFARAMQRLIQEEEKNRLPVLTLEKTESETSRQVGKVLESEGLPKGSMVLLVDDLISTSLSKIEAATALRQAGYQVNHCMVFLDREMGGRQRSHAQGLEVHSIENFTSLFLTYRDLELITDEQFTKIMAYQKAESRLQLA